jgi:hypothetical protein
MVAKSHCVGSGLEEQKLLGSWLIHIDISKADTRVSEAFASCCRRHHFVIRAIS